MALDPNKPWKLLSPSFSFFVIALSSSRNIVWRAHNLVEQQSPSRLLGEFFSQENPVELICIRLRRPTRLPSRTKVNNKICDLRTSFLILEIESHFGNMSFRCGGANSCILSEHALQERRVEAISLARTKISTFTHMNIQERSESTFDVHWYGPYSEQELNEKYGGDRSMVLYSIYGPHPLYGHDVLLYIGMTESCTSLRISQHRWWTGELAGSIKIFVAAVAPFTTWKDMESMEDYPPLDEKVIRCLEGLLIFAHQPVFNVKCRDSLSGDFTVRLFNTGSIRDLYPEVSSTYYRSHT
jgi:hypothetical protein